MAEKEYIERRAALLSITNDGCTASNVGALMRVPAADVVEVVHGEWLAIDPNSDVRFFCSECDTEISTSWDYDDSEMWRYCPNCGAKMDGKDGEEK